MCTKASAARHREARRLLAGVCVGLALFLLIGGCDGRPAEQSTAVGPAPAEERRETVADTPDPVSPPEAAPASSDPVAEPSPSPVPLEFPEGPTVGDEYPELASAALVHARLVALSGGVVLQAGDLVVTREDIEKELAQSLPQVREQLSKSGFFFLEQMATERLLVREARQSPGAKSGDDQTVVQAYMREVVGTPEVSAEDVAAFYEENRELVGSVPLAQVEEQIRRHLMQEKQQHTVNLHVRTIGQRIPVAVAADWAAEQAERARDNVVDRARASGLPTIASFGADTCIPCQKMAPVREAISKKYKGKVNVVYVHVGNEQVLAARYGVQAIPYLIFFDGAGREVHRHTGMMSQEKMEEHIARLGVQG